MLKVAPIELYLHLEEQKKEETKKTEEKPGANEFSAIFHSELNKLEEK